MSDPLQENRKIGETQPAKKYSPKILLKDRKNEHFPNDENKCLCVCILITYFSAAFALATQPHQVDETDKIEKPFSHFR